MTAALRTRSPLTRSGGGQRRNTRGAVPTWIPLALLFGGLFAGLAALQGDARRHGVATIDATRYRIQTGSRWMSPAWIQRIEDMLVETRDIRAEDVGEIRAFAARVEGLPFVAAVGAPEVQWPDGLALPVKFHEPVACVPVGGRDYLPVASDGTVLDGYSFAPHEAYGGWLPTLGPHGLLEPSESRGGTAGSAPRPGSALTADAHLRALGVADSMWSHLAAEDLRRLGRVFIDASADDAPVFDRRAGSMTPRRLPGGVVIALEDGRRVYFGRPPMPLADGELPVHRKWAHVREALHAAEKGADWALLDVRFDDPVVLSRGEVEQFARDGVLRRELNGDER